MIRKLWLALLIVAMSAMPTFAQDPKPSEDEKKTEDNARELVIQYARPYDGRGVNMFEAPKYDAQPLYKGVQFQLGGAFTQQFQALSHENASTNPANELIKMGMGFNNATANVRMEVQLAEGIHMHTIMYASARHHNEAWMKGGYLQIDKLPIDHPLLNFMMAISRIKAGHMEINYGDSHLRRSDNGNAMYNPFIGNPLMDSFATEVGVEGYAFLGNLMVMGGMTGGEIKGNILTPEKRSPAWLGKVSYDKSWAPGKRARLSGSLYTVSKSAGSTLYAGDRAGSRYYFALEAKGATADAQFRTGLINPGFGRNVTAVQVNPFLKFNGLEMFGIVERASGRSASESVDRTWNHFAGDVIYRFSFTDKMPKESMYVAGRYNVAKGELSGIGNEVSATRYQLGLGHFLTPHILTKAEYVWQKHDDYPASHLLHKGKFNGFVMEGVITF